METSDSYKGRLRIRDSISCSPTTPDLLYLLHRAGWSGDAVAATSFTTAALIGTALALEAQAMASPAARLRKKSVLRMNVSPEVPVGNDVASLCSTRFSEVRGDI